ncbi:MAG: hypothetical protein KDI13_11385 [Alphaproteobacteria bacterium]|nr:hypothetical protein [Alphaproteobacteria bacterium]
MVLQTRDIEQLAQSYIKYALAKTDEEREAIFDVGMNEIDRIQFESPDDLWLIILKIHALTDDPQVLSLLSAGLLENLLSLFPSQSIDWVEEQARKDPRFKKLLRGVWQNLMSDETWQRVQKLIG